MARIEQIHTSESGKHLQHPLSKQIAGLLFKTTNKEHFTTLWNARISIPEMARKLELTTSQVEFLREYWEMPERLRSNASSYKVMEVDALSDRLWEDFAPRITKMINDAIEAI